MKIEKGKTYRLYLKGLDGFCLLLPIENNYISPRVGITSFRYTHNINYYGFNLNELNCDYINDAIMNNESIVISDGEGGIDYVMIEHFEEISESNTFKDF